MIKLIKFLAKNPLWTFGWSLSCLAFGYLIKREHTIFEQQINFQKIGIELNSKETEYKQANNMVNLYLDVLNGLMATDKAHIDSINNSINFSTLSHDQIIEVVKPMLKNHIEKKK